MRKKKNTAEVLEPLNTQNLKHLAFIMDGNGRWAQKRGLKREIGHIYGAKTTKRLMQYCLDIGIKCVTIYAFSTENWKRPIEEVNALINLFSSYIDDFMINHEKYNGRFKFIGDLSVFDESFRERIRKVEEISAHKEAQLNIAINYGGRAELLRSVNNLIDSGAKNVTADDITHGMYTNGCPEPDMIVRTGGDKRLSNFLLWQSAYSELYFTDTLWPDLKEKEIDEIVREFNRRKRRYGGV